MFSITRKESWGHVQNSVKYDKRTLDLDTYVRAATDEGGGYTTTYQFKFKGKRKDAWVTFVEDYRDYQYETVYKYNSKTKNVSVLRNQPRPSSRLYGWLCC